jgi:RNA polymerase sigma-B factor
MRRRPPMLRDAPGLGVGRPRLQERDLLLRYHHGGDLHARELLVRRFLPLARNLARRYQVAGEPIDDLVQVASIGLLKAIDRFDPERGTTLTTFAVPTILGELKRHFRDHGWAVRVPRGLQERAQRVEHATEVLCNELGRSPTTNEIAARAETTSEEVLEARQAAGAYRAIPLEVLDSGAADASPAECLGIEDPGYRRAEEAVTIEQFMSCLNDRDREILRLRFEEELIQSEIGERVGLSQMQVSRLIQRSLAALQELAEQPAG